ncbi:MAG: DNA polymerase III subunit chi [Methylotetracoccus sp.]
MRIDFYLVPDGDPRGRYLTACRLTEKAYRLGHRIYIQTESEQTAALLDDLLWTFRQNSFVPHARWPAGEQPETPVFLGTAEPPEFLDDVLINLSDAVPSTFDRFARLVEIVDQDETGKEAGRRRFRFYRDRGLTPATHKLESASD